MCLISAVLPAAGGEAEANRAPARILEEVRSHRSGIALWWVGNAGWLVKADGVLVGIDLDLELQERIEPPPVSAEELAGEIDVAFATHHHGDHFNAPTLAKIAGKPRCTFVLPRTCLAGAAAAGIPRDRIVVPEPLVPFEIKGVSVRPLHAIHGNQMFTVLTREPDFVESIAHNCGYLMRIGGRTFFWPGDSVLTEEHLALRDVNVLFVSPTVHNMHVDRSAILINALQPDLVIPQHFGTYREDDENRFWTKGYPDELRLVLSADLQKRYRKLAVGERLVVP
ncbi:MAG TPA: MBL fold metallo-hydrolase [Vicinamibacteria bacterium]|nr:MBL fold metallo-hydrolase [Vicinamibacteria bacterium]